MNTKDTAVFKGLLDEINERYGKDTVTLTGDGKLLHNGEPCGNTKGYNLLYALNLLCFATNNELHTVSTYC